MDNIRVAIVEDLNEIREALRVLIDGSMGFSCVDVFENGEMALVELPSKQIDVIIMDINMPGMSGIDCTMKLKPLMPQTHFMMYTVYDNDENIFAALKGGATGYILKRTSPAAILESIRELMAGGSPMSGEIARRVVASLQNKKQNKRKIEILTPREKGDIRPPRQRISIQRNCSCYKCKPAPMLSIRLTRVSLFSFSFLRW
ncbi:MAG: response regulator transcription factor [Bacteroidetes bacterium]|nr:response regulator transcription factor [Bacteroidota bacterium]